MNNDLLELVRDLARILSLEYGDVDDQDLGSIEEGIKVLEKAKAKMEACGLEIPEATQMILEHFAARK